MLESLLNLLYRRKRATLCAAALALCIAVCFVPRLSINDSPERWLPASISDAWARFGEHFGHGDTIVVGLQFHDHVKNDDLSYLASLRADLESVPGILRVIDLSLLAREVERVPLIEILAPPVPGKPDRFAAYRGVLFDDARGRASGRTLLTICELDATVAQDVEKRRRQDMLDTRRRQAIAAIYRIVDKHDRDDVTFHVVGGVVVQYELEKIARRTLLTLVPLSALLTLVALGLGFRSISAAAISLLGGAWSILVLLGGIALLGWTLDVVTVSGPPLMSVIVIAATVQFAHHHSVNVWTEEGAGGSSPSRFLSWVAVPCFGAALAAGVGFLMLAFNELGPAREMGIELFFGANLAFLGAFIFWLVLHPFRAAPGRLLSSRNLGRLQRNMVAYPRTVVAAMLVLTGLLVWQSTRVTLDADPFSFFQPESPFARAIRHLTDRGFGHHILDVVLVPKHHPADPEEAAAERAKDLEAARAFQRKVKSLPEVHNVVSALELSARVQSLEALAADFRRAVAFRGMFKNWTNDRKGEGAIRITFTVCDPGTGFKNLMETARAALPQDRFEGILTGTVASVVALSDGLVGGIARGLGSALLLMALLCAVLFRSLRLTVVAFLPNAFPILLIFGLMGACGIPLNSGSAMVATIALGMALNDTVHFIMHYHRSVLSGAAPGDAVAATFSEIGRPLIVTSAVNCVGFGIFLLSDFRPMYHFGLLSSIAMIAALIGDMVLLPNLLKLFPGVKSTAERTES